MNTTYLEATRKWKSLGKSTKYARALAAPNGFLALLSEEGSSLRPEIEAPKVSLSLTKAEYPSVTLKSGWRWNTDVLEESQVSGSEEFSSLAKSIPIRDLLTISDHDVLIWVKSFNGVWMPAAIPKELWSYASSLYEKRTALNELPQEALDLLLFVEVIQEERVVQPEQLEFKSKGHILLKEILSHYQLFILGRYGALLRALGVMRLGDRDSPLRAWAHNDQFSRWIHQQITPYVNSRLGTTLNPYFTNWVVYKGGSELPVHKDKHPDAFSLSVSIDFSDEMRRGPDAWSFHVEKGAGKGEFQEYRIGLGNGVLFHGSILDHYRTVLPEKQEATILLLNYIQPDSRLLYR